jgi:hypothetical protein
MDETPTPDASILRFEAGMATAQGRVLEVSDAGVVVFSKGSASVDPAPVADLEDRATTLLLLEQVAKRTGLDATGGLLWYVQTDEVDDVWVLEGAWETRHRDGDTLDPQVALLRALAETAAAR